MSSQGWANLENTGKSEKGHLGKSGGNRGEMTYFGKLAKYFFKSCVKFPEYKLFNLRTDL